MDDFLFEEFPSISAKQWKQKIQFDLNGADYNETLITHTSEGINIKPFYHSDDFEQIEIPTSSSEFHICQEIFISDPQKANYLALEALKKGATSILFIAKEPFEIEPLLKSISETEIHFQLHFLSENFILELANKLKKNNVSLNIDIIGNLAKSGNWFYNLNQDFEILKNLKSTIPDAVSLLNVNTSLYQNAGANCVQQVAYALAHANEYLNFFDGKLGSKIQFNFSTGSNYFFEIAKLRAFRHLWQLLCKEYNTEIEASLFIQPTFRNKTLYTSENNLYRTSTECMSAIIGGANTISNISFDSIYRKKNETGETIALQQLVSLKNEIPFENNLDISEGSYYIESLTKDIAEKALVIFKDIEKSGGFLKALKEGIIQRKIKETADKEQALFTKKEVVLIGVNKHQAVDEKINDQIELYPFVKTKPRKTLISPIISKRLTEEMEQERLKNEA